MFLDDGVHLLADASGLHYTHPHRAWRAMRHNGHRVPADPLLHRLAGFVVDRRFPVAVYDYPKLLAWSEDGRTLTIRWPQGTDLKKVLGGPAERPAA